MPHKDDNTGRCIYCGLNSDEWFRWRYNTFAGMLSKAVYPECKRQELDKYEEEYERVES